MLRLEEVRVKTFVNVRTKVSSVASVAVDALATVAVAGAQTFIDLFHTRISVFETYRRSR